MAACRFATVTRALQAIGPTPAPGTVIKIVGASTVPSVGNANALVEVFPLTIPTNVTVTAGSGQVFVKPPAGGTAFVLADADAGTKKPAFDQERLAAAISSAAGKNYTGLKLPFTPVTGRPGARPIDPTLTRAPLTFVDSERSIQFGIDGSMYKCDLSDYKCAKVGPIPRPDRALRHDAHVGKNVTRL